MDSLNTSLRDILKSFVLLPIRVVNEQDAAMLRITIRN